MTYASNRWNQTASVPRAASRPCDLASSGCPKRSLQPGSGDGLFLTHSWLIGPLLDPVIRNRLTTQRLPETYLLGKRGKDSPRLTNTLVGANVIRGFMHHEAITQRDEAP